MTEYTVVEGDVIRFPDGESMAVRSESKLIRIPRDLGMQTFRMSTNQKGFAPKSPFWRRLLGIH